MKKLSFILMAFCLVSANAFANCKNCEEKAKKKHSHSCACKNQKSCDKDCASMDHKHHKDAPATTTPAVAAPAETPRS